MTVTGSRGGIEPQSSSADDGFNAFVPGERARLAPQRAGILSGLSFAVKDLRSEEHTSELQSPDHLVCRLLLEKKKINNRVKNKHHMQKIIQDQSEPRVRS